MPDGSKAGAEELTGVGVFLRPGSHPQMASAVPAPLWMQSAGGHHTACLLFSLVAACNPTMRQSEWFSSMLAACGTQGKGSTKLAGH